jgi:hypothetical protein
LKRLKDILLNLLIMGVTVALAVTLLEVIRPNTLRQGAALLGLPVSIRYMAGMGDSFVYQGHITAPPPNPYEVLAEYMPAYDANGFRLPLRPSERYDVVALGDSFTEAYVVARTWADVLAEQSGLSVLNMGVRGYGMVEAARIFREFPPAAPPRVVIVAYFEGNDLSNAQTIDERPFVYPNAARPPDEARQNALWRFEHTPQERYKYPMTAVLNGREQPITLLEGYIWALNMTREEVERSNALARIADAWRDIQAHADGACVVLAYLPSKERAFLPHIPAEQRARAFDTPYRNRVDENGVMLIEEARGTTYDTLLPLMDNVRHAVLARAEAEGLRVIDLTPAVLEATANGALLYYVYDTHANQDGNDLFGRVIAEQLPAVCGL